MNSGLRGFDEPPLSDSRDPIMERFNPLPEDLEKDHVQPIDVFEDDIIGFVRNPRFPDAPLVGYKVKDDIWVRIKSSRSDALVEGVVRIVAMNEQECFVIYGTEEHPSYKWVPWNECIPPVKARLHPAEDEEDVVPGPITIIGREEVLPYEHANVSIQEIRLPVRQKIVDICLKGKDPIKGIVTAVSADGGKVLVQSLEGKQAFWVPSGKTQPPLNVLLQSDEASHGDAGKITV